MNKLAFSSLESNPEDEVTVEETLETKPVPQVMEKSLINTKREARAQALYILFNWHEE